MSTAPRTTGCASTPPWAPARATPSRTIPCSRATTTSIAWNAMEAPRPTAPLRSAPRATWASARRAAWCRDVSPSPTATRRWPMCASPCGPPRRAPTMPYRAMPSASAVPPRVSRGTLLRTSWRRSLAATRTSPCRCSSGPTPC